MFNRCRFVKSVAKNLAEARAAEFLPEVFAFHFDDAAHFVQPGAHAFADAGAESFFAGGASWCGDGSGATIVDIGCGNRCAGGGMPGFRAHTYCVRSSVV